MTLDSGSSTPRGSPERASDGVEGGTSRDFGNHGGKVRHQPQPGAAGAGNQSDSLTADSATKATKEQDFGERQQSKDQEHQEQQQQQQQQQQENRQKNNQAKPKQQEQVMGRVTHVLFDMDGLLLDTERLYSIAQQGVLDRFGIEFTWEVKSKMMGRKAQDAANVLLDVYGLKDKLTAEEFLRERNKILKHLFPKVEILPGVERLLLHLHSHGIPMAVATSSHVDNVKVKTKKHRHLFDKVFSHIITGDQVVHSKPSPDIFLKAARRFDPDIDPSHCLVLEDAPVGVDAALAAGMNVVLVSKDLAPRKVRPPHQHLKSMTQFKPEVWGLPPFPPSSSASKTASSSSSSSSSSSAACAPADNSSSS